MDPVVSTVDFKLRDFDLSLGSEFIPPTSSHPVETFIHLVKRDIDVLKCKFEHLRLKCEFILFRMVGTKNFDGE